MRKTLVLAAFLVAGQLCAAAPALAHHSFAMFEAEKEVVLDGTIVSFQWTNPHAWIDIKVNDTQGRATQWSIEMNGPGGLVRNGWTRTSIKPGDKVSLKIHPLRTGEPGGSYISITLPDGKKLN